jgi:hypothetical protein
MARRQWIIGFWLFGGKYFQHLLGILYPWISRNDVPSKNQEPIIQWPRDTFQNSGILIHVMLLLIRMEKHFKMFYTVLTKGTRSQGRKLLSLYFLKYSAYTSIKIFKIKCQDLNREMFRGYHEFVAQMIKWYKLSVTLDRCRLTLTMLVKFQ